MAVAVRVMQLFNRYGLPFRQVHHERVGSLAAALAVADVDPQRVVRAELLIDARGVLMAVLPFHRHLDLAALSHRLGRSLQPLSSLQADRLFRDCEPGSHPPLSAAYGLPAVLDEGLLEFDRVYFQSGCHSTLIGTDLDTFLQLNRRALSLPIAYESGREPEGAEPVPPPPGQQLERLIERLKRIYKLPPMPSVAARILQLLADPNAGVRDLTRIIEQDPSLAAQVMRCARSAMYGYRGDVLTLQDAIGRVLGFERVSHIALGLAASRAFDIPRDGPLGLRAFWRHALHCSWLSQQLAIHLPRERAVEPGLAYLCGLLHNFGLLLIGHLFRPEFVLLNKLAASDPEASITALEKQVFGMGGAQELMGLGHGKIGAVLMECWNLPPQIMTVADMHHVTGYRGPHQTYVQLVQLANSLLKEEAIGDERGLDDPAPLMEDLGLSPELTYEIFRQVRLYVNEVQTLAAQLAA